MANRHPPQSWPMDATRLPQPGIGLALAATAILLVGFCGATALFAWHVQQIGGIAGAWANEPPALIGVGAFALGTALALVAFFAVMLSVLRNAPVWHAAASVLSDIPSEPVDGRDHPFGDIQPEEYVLKPVEGGWWFGLKAKNLHYGFRWFGIPWMTLVSGVIVLVIWRYTDNPRAIKAAFTCFLAFACGMMCVIFWYLPKMIKALPFAAIDLASGVCKLGPEPITSIPLDQIVAVQLCACQRRRQDSITNGIEVNLVWQPESEHAEPDMQKYRRMTLMFIVGPSVCRKARLAGELAEKLGVPLVCHATAEHWRLERRATKLRQPAQIKWPTFGKKLRTANL